MKKSPSSLCFHTLVSSFCSGNVGGEAIIFVTTSSGKYSVIGFFHLGVLPEIRRVSIKVLNFEDQS
ncbi:hypothetical protein S83_067439 [Arachis hypogaea]